MASGAGNIRSASGGGADIDLFMVPFSASASSFTALAPTRVFDTRQNIGGVGTSKIGDGRGNGTPLAFSVTGNGGVPATGVGAVSLNVTVVDFAARYEACLGTVFPVFPLAVSIHRTLGRLGSVATWGVEMLR